MTYKYYYKTPEGFSDILFINKIRKHVLNVELCKIKVISIVHIVVQN